MAARAEENAYFVAVMKGAGNKKVSGLQVPDWDHVTIIRNTGCETESSVQNYG